MIIGEAAVKVKQKVQLNKRKSLKVVGNVVYVARKDTVDKSVRVKMNMNVKFEKFGYISRNLVAGSTKSAFLNIQQFYLVYIYKVILFHKKSN